MNDWRTGPVILHIDVNSAYVSWSAMDHLRKGGKLDYRTVPSIVGGDPVTRHGIVLAKSIPAKKYGIQTAELVWQAVRKCPKLIVLPPDHRLYAECSKAFINLVRQYSDRVFVYSVDECWVDLTYVQKLFGDPLILADRIREEIRDQLGFTVSVGVSSNIILAKMASDLKKPDALTTLWPWEIEEKMWPLPVGDLFMCGKATTQKLNNIGIKTIGQLARLRKETVVSHLKSHGALIWGYANGQGSIMYDLPQTKYIPKGVGNSTVIPWDVSDPHEAELVLLSLAESVGMRLRRDNLIGDVISIYIRYEDFTGIGHQQKVLLPTNSTSEIFEIAKRLLHKLWQNKSKRLRHIGLRVNNVRENYNVQLALDDGRQDKLIRLDQTVDKIRDKHGLHAITRAAFVGSRFKPIKGITLEDEIPAFTDTTFSAQEKEEEKRKKLKVKEHKNES